jgi:hypothetical protein
MKEFDNGQCRNDPIMAKKLMDDYMSPLRTDFTKLNFKPGHAAAHTALWERIVKVGSLSLKFIAIANCHCRQQVKVLYTCHGVICQRCNGARSSQN